jgi:N-acetylmuramoyl-L-alanine amidase
MAYSVKNGLLFKDDKQVPFVKSPNVGGALKPSVLVMHYTGALSTKGAINTLTNSAAKVSAHLVLSPEGEVTQLVPFNRVAWHAGISKWHNMVGLNQYAIGIEMVNAGLLGKNAKGEYFARLENKVLPPEQVTLAHHKNGSAELPWQIYPIDQFEAAVAIAQAITKAYGIKEIVGHDDIAPGRKTDPGPAWHMGAFVGQVLGRQ